MAIFGSIWGLNSPSRHQSLRTYRCKQAKHDSTVLIVRSWRQVHTKFQTKVSFKYLTVTWLSCQFRHEKVHINGFIEFQQIVSFWGYSDVLKIFYARSPRSPGRGPICCHRWHLTLDPGLESKSLKLPTAFLHGVIYLTSSHDTIPILPWNQPASLHDGCILGFLNILGWRYPRAPIWPIPISL